MNKTLGSTPALKALYAKWRFIADSLVNSSFEVYIIILSITTLRLIMSINRVFDAFMTHVYNTEDSLYQILYDKSYRPEVYKLKTS